MFPNRHNVFIHDTSARSGFQRNYRFFSHGCIRVENPHELAMLLLGPNDGWNRERLDEILSEEDEIIVRLQRPVMVHITYLTAWALRRGEVHFRRDAYDRDQELIEAMRAAQGGLPLDPRPHAE
jgi:murein L,D-transpeptidase YcbB/YkuD